MVQIEKVEAFVESERSRAKVAWAYVNQLIAAEISSVVRYYDRLIQVYARQHDSGMLFDAIECSRKEVLRAGQVFPDLSGEREARTALLLNGILNHHLDIQSLLLDLHPRLSRGSRLIVVAYNPYLSWLYRLATILRLRSGETPSTFVTRTDLENLAKLADYEIVRCKPAVFFPWSLFGIGSLINRVLPSVPLLRWTGLVSVFVVRPLISEKLKRPTLSIVIPARNEAGNIENALKRMPDLGVQLEVIFVEGNSTDDTWKEIQRVVSASTYSSRFKLACYQQTGKGKNDAVQLGFRKATGELLTILDADLTMPPELLGRFYNAYCEGRGDFINGTRLVYPMEGDAMRPLNRLGNIFFAKALSWVLDVRLGDSLCGTKLVSRADYARILTWKRDFGDFDPFGDFELLFPAAILGYGIIDIPIRYRARTYGTTNISRFRHGLMLLRMTLVGFFKIRMGLLPR